MGRVCPWWGGYFIDNPLRRLLHDPEKILRPYATPGMTVMDIGCGMGFFSIAMAKIVAEPRLHVRGRAFEAMVRLAEGAGLNLFEQRHVRWCRAAVFAKQ